MREEWREVEGGKEVEGWRKGDDMDLITKHRREITIKTKKKKFN